MEIMETNQNLNARVAEEPLKQSYYVNKWRKSGDFCMGFIGVYFYVAIVTYVFEAVAEIGDLLPELSLPYGTINESFAVVFILASLVIYFKTYKKTFKIERKFIGKGMLAAVILGSLFLLWCLGIVFLAVN